MATVHTIAYIFLSMTFQGKTFDLSQFAQYLAETQQDRVRRYGPNAAFLVVEASHEEEAASIGEIGQSDERDFCVALQNGFREQVETRHKAFLDQAQSFLSFAMPSATRLEDAGSWIVADHPSGKPLYVMTASMSARPTLSHPIPADGASRFATLFQHSAKLENFRTTFRLAAGSTLNTQDNLRAFLFAFTALEVYLSKAFKQHKQRLSSLTKNDLSPKIHYFVEKIRKSRKETGRTDENYPVAYNFAPVASYLGLEDIDQRFDEMDSASRIRNDIVHGNEFNEAPLPTDKIRNLLSELIGLYVQVE